MNKQRITLEDDVISAMAKLAEGNPGALTVMVELYKNSPKIDPDAAFGRMSHIFDLDREGIYGSRIWMFYKDVCNHDMVKMIAVLRGIQLGKLSPGKVNHAIDNMGEGLDLKVNHAIDNMGEGLDLDAILEMVKKELPDFGRCDLEDPVHDDHTEEN